MANLNEGIEKKGGSKPQTSIPRPAATPKPQTSASSQSTRR